MPARRPRRADGLPAVPAEYQHRVRHSNFIERTFGETRGLTMTADGLRLLQDLRRGLLDPPRQLRTRAVTATRDDERPENVSATARRR